MNIKTKKVIAREFLILLLCIAIAIIAFLSIYPYNYFKQNQIDNLTKSVFAKKIRSDSLSKSYRQKSKNQLWFTEQYNSKFDISINGDYSSTTMWNRLNEIAKSDSVTFKWENTWPKELITFSKQLGFQTPQSLQSFILANAVTSKEINANQKASNINSEIASLQTQIDKFYTEKVSPKNQESTAILSFIIALFGLFLCRFLFYGTKWSIKILKQS